MVEKGTITEQELIELSKDYALHSNKYEEENQEKKNYRIRKFTPRECLRLMGVKNEDITKMSENQSNSSIYHLAGDSIVTTCLMGLFGQMFNVDWKQKVKETIGEIVE